MPQQAVFIATDNKKAVEFLAAYFSETQSAPTVIRLRADLSVLFSCRVNLLFLQSDWADEKMMGKLAEFKAAHPELKCFSLGTAPKGAISWDGEIELPIEEKAFRKIILHKIGLPDPIKLVAVDDESEVIELIKDYFEPRKDPAFKLRTASNGLEGFKLIQEENPHCLILDLKMPVRSGVDLYRDLTRTGLKIPTIIYIDSTTADDVLEIRKLGNPVFVEKGGPFSSMPDMLALVKKLVAFS